MNSVERIRSFVLTYALLDLDRCVLVPDVLLLLLVDVCGEHLHLHCQRPGIQEGLQALPQGCVHVYTGCFNGYLVVVETF